MAPIAAALDSGRVHGASRPSEGFPPPSLRGALFEGHLEVHNLVGEIWVVRDRQGGGPIRDLHAMACPWLRGKTRSSTVLPAGCVGVRTSGLSEAETGSEPKVSPANACWPAFSLRDWRSRIHLLNDEGTAVGCGWRPAASKIQELSVLDYMTEPEAYGKRERCFTGLGTAEAPTLQEDSDSSRRTRALKRMTLSTPSRRPRWWPHLWRPRFPRPWRLGGGGGPGQGSGQGPQHRLASFGNGGCARLSFGNGAISLHTRSSVFESLWRVAHGAHPAVDI